MKSQTPQSSLQETQQKNESYKSYEAIDKNFLPLPAGTKQRTCSLERWNGTKDTKRQEETSAHSGMHRIGPICREGNSPKNAITKDKTIDAKMLPRPVQLLRRRLKPCKTYQHGNSQMSVLRREAFLRTKHGSGAGVHGERQNDRTKRF